MVVHIPRHLAQAHQWSPSRSRAALTNFNLRKKYTFKSQKIAEAGNRKRKYDGNKAIKAHKDYHKKRVCPLPGCSSCVKRLPAHLKNVHEISPLSDEYESLLKKALSKRKRPYSVQVIENRLREKGDEDALVLKRKRSSSVDSNEVDAVSPKRKRSSSVHVFEVDVDEGVDERAPTVEREESEVDDEGDENDPALIVKFANWLQSPDGGNKDSKTVKQHAAQVNRILSVIDNDRNVESLLDFAVIKEKFVKYAQEKYVPETIKSYQV